jgi:hypothetical protein
MMTVEIGETLGTLRPICLDELLQRAALQQRVDRKYLLPMAELGPGVTGAGAGRAHPADR